MADFAFPATFSCADADAGLAPARGVRRVQRRPAALIRRRTPKEPKEPKEPSPDVTVRRLAHVYRQISGPGRLISARPLSIFLWFRVIFS